MSKVTMKPIRYSNLGSSHNIGGLWSIQAEWLSLHLEQVQALARPVPMEWLSHYMDQWALQNGEENPFLDLDEEARGVDDMITIMGNSIATIPIEGPMIKQDSWLARIFGFASTRRIQKAVQQAAKDSEVKGIMLAIDSPGGHVAGVNELAETVRQVRREKEVFAHIDDLGASAAYWVASQARSISANAMADVGSLGVMAMVADSSGLYESAGIKVHLLRTGEHKGVGAPGVPISDEQLAVLQKRVDDTNRVFMRAVRAGRGLSTDELNAVNDGRVFGASDARDLKLIDRIRSFEGAIADASRALSDNSRSVRQSIAGLRQLHTASAS